MLPSRIRILNDQTINKIAAGEVIENPASVVKELVENSLDAGSSTICVEIQGGGRQLVRVSDDGCGMSCDDALLCLERHATSKIREVEDIQELLTMGFRGEAIPSIAAVSKFTLLTCPRLEGVEKTGEGTLLIVDGGKLVSCAPAARAPGTTIEVKSLFFNVPVRRKFQKSPAFDTQEILKMLGLLSLGYPTIQFELVSDQKSLLKTTKCSLLLPFHDLLGKRLEGVLGKEYASSLLPLKFHQPPYELEGFIGSPLAHKPNRTGQHLFINQRLIYSSLIALAVREGYGSMLPTHRYPLFVLHFRLPGTFLDVNVHPQKKEVRLRQEHQLKETIIQAVQTALRQEQKALNSLPMEENSSSSNSPPFWSPYASLLSPFPKSPSLSSEGSWEFKPAVVDSSHSCPFTGLIEPSPPFSSSPKNPEGLLVEETAFAASSTNSSSSIPRPLLASNEVQQRVQCVLATLSGYFIIDSIPLEGKLFQLTRGKREGGLALIDQRAAYARIYYEHLLKRSSAQEIQSLLIPLTLNLTIDESHVVREYLVLLNQMGFSLREFGEQTFVVDAFPLFIKQDQLHTCISLLIQDLVDMQTTRRLQIKKEEQLALAACRASIPATKRLTLEEAQGLLQQLLTCELPTQCPMGRPICLYLAPDEIARWFQK